MTADDSTDVAVIGAGVVGCAVASAIARSGRSVLILERGPRECTGVSSRNSGVIHSGLYYPPDSLKARTCVRGQALLYAWARARDVPHRQTGKLVIVPHDPEAHGGERAAERVALEQLHAIHANAQKSGARDCDIVTRDATARLEPNLPAVASAMLCPHSGIVDVHALTRSLLVDAEDRGAVLATHATVTAIEADEARGHRLETTRGPVRATQVINAAGLASDRVAAMAGLDGYTIYPCRGDYFRLRRGPTFRHLIYPVRLPGDRGLGVHLTLELDGGQRLGPDAYYVEARDDWREPPAAKHAVFLAATRELLGASIQPEHLAYDSCGIRPKLRAPHETVEKDFVIREHPTGIIHMIGIESPGLTASLALAGDIVAML